MEEAFRQGDEERKLGLDIGPLGDRENVSIEHCQVGHSGKDMCWGGERLCTCAPHPQMTFIDYFLHPLWETWAELVYPDAQPMMDYLSKTREYWSRLLPKSPSPSVEEEEETFEGDSIKDQETPNVSLLQSPDHSSQKRYSEVLRGWICVSVCTVSCDNINTGGSYSGRQGGIH